MEMHFKVILYPSTSFTYSKAFRVHLPFLDSASLLMGVPGSVLRKWKLGKVFSR